MRSPLPIAERFWRMVTPVEGCWPWRGSRNKAGYGQFRIGRRGPVMTAHRVSWDLHNGPIPEGLIVMHRCDNPSCVNPGHLFLGTHKDNAQDMIRKGRKAKHHAAHTRTRKLTDDQVRSIRHDHRPAHTIALEHGVSESAIYNVKAGRRKALVLSK